MEQITMMGIEFLPTDTVKCTATKLILLKAEVNKNGWDGCKTEWAKKLISRIIVTCPPKSSKAMLWALWNSEPWVLTGVMWRFNEYLKEYGSLTAYQIETIVTDCVRASNYDRYGNNR